MVDSDRVLFVDALVNLLQRMKARAEYSTLGPGEDAVRAHHLRTQSRSSKESTLKCSPGEIAAHALHLDDFDRTPSSVVHGRYPDLRPRFASLDGRRELLRPPAPSLIGTARLLATVSIRAPIHPSSPSFRVTSHRPLHGPLELLRGSGGASAFQAGPTRSRPQPRLTNRKGFDPERRAPGMAPPAALVSADRLLASPASRERFWPAADKQQETPRKSPY
jgi:hypothetical protein